MKNMKRIFAVIGVILLLSMVGVFLYAGIVATPDSHSLLMASIYCIIVIPIMLYAYILVYRLLKKRAEEEKKKNEEGK